MMHRIDCTPPFVFHQLAGTSFHVNLHYASVIPLMIHARAFHKESHHLMHSYRPNLLRFPHISGVVPSCHTFMHLSRTKSTVSVSPTTPCAEFLLKSLPEHLCLSTVCDSSSLSDFLTGISILLFIRLTLYINQIMVQTTGNHPNPQPN
jgi:hypothetical protein